MDRYLAGLFAYSLPLSVIGAVAPYFFRKSLEGAIASGVLGAIFLPLMMFALTDLGKADAVIAAAVYGLIFGIAWGTLGKKSPSPCPGNQNSLTPQASNNQLGRDIDKYSKYADRNRARGSTVQTANNQPRMNTRKQAKDSDLDVEVNNTKKYASQFKNTKSLRDQDMKLLEVTGTHPDANYILKELEDMGSRVGIIDLPLNDKKREILLGTLGWVARKRLLKEYSLLEESIDANWSEEFEILFEYDSVVKGFHNSLNELDPNLSDQFRQEVVKDRNQSKNICARLMAEHDKKMNPYDSGDLNQAYSEAKKLGPSAGDEFVRIIEIMGEDVDVGSILGKLKEKYS